MVSVYDCYADTACEEDTTSCPKEDRHDIEPERSVELASRDLKKPQEEQDHDDAVGNAREQRQQDPEVPSFVSPFTVMGRASGELLPTD